MPDTTPSPTMNGPPAPDAPITRAEFDALMQRLGGIERGLSSVAARSVRTETKVMRLLEHHGLDSRGLPITINHEEGSHA